MDDSNKFNSHDTQLSIILGFFAGIFIYIFIINRPIIKGPNSKDVIKMVYTINDRQYMLEPMICPCPIKIFGPIVWPNKN